MTQNYPQKKAARIHVQPFVANTPVCVISQPHVWRIATPHVAKIPPIKAQSEPLRNPES